MQIIPAIDIKGGKCVRLRQGEFTQVETYSEDPVKYAQKWQAAGAQRLHVVDLDGARMGTPQNTDTIRKIVRALSIPVQLGGGIRSMEIIERMLNIGIDRVILGTSIAQNDQLAQSAFTIYGDKVIVGLDAKDGMVAVSGWLDRTNESAVAFARRMQSMGAKRIIFTDISRDGMLTGPNTVSLAEMLQTASIPVIASGGVGSIQDIHTLLAMKSAHLEGVIVGKALYAGKMDLAEAIALVSKG